MLRSVKISVAVMAATAVLAGVAYAATRPIPQQQPGVALQNPDGLALPGDVKALEAALSATGPVQYKVLVVDSTDGEDLTGYLDRVAAEWKQPAQDTLLLVLFTKENYNLRFYMGPGFRAKGVTVDEMLALVRSQYFAHKTSKGDVAGGLVNLIAAVNQRMSGEAVAEAGAAPAQPQTGEAAKRAKISVADPFGGGRHTAAGQVQIAKTLLTEYLNGYKTVAVDEASRLRDFRVDERFLNVVSGSDTNTLVFEVKFDVLPVSSTSTWSASHGAVAEGGWLQAVTRYMAVTREGNEWVLVLLSSNNENK